MTRARTALLVLVLLAVSYVVVDRLDPDDVARNTARVDRWETVTDEAAGFTVELPAPVLRSVGSRTIGPGGQVAVYQRHGGSMGLEWFDYPEADPPLADPVAEAERRAVAMFREASSGRMVTVSGQPEEVAGRPGASLRITLGPRLVRGWAVVDGGQFFLLTAEVGQGWQAADQDRLVRSFRLLPST